MRPEQITDNTRIYRERTPPDHARRAGLEVPELLTVDYLREFVDEHYWLSRKEGATWALSFAYGEYVESGQIDQQDQHLYRLIETWHLRTIGRLLIEARSKTQYEGYPLSGVFVHANMPGTAFPPHFDGLEGYVKYQALSEVYLRLHNDDHSIREEYVILPGDEVEFSNPSDPLARDIHSFMGIEGLRAAIVSKYRNPETDFPDEPVGKLADYYNWVFSPRTN